MKELVLLKTRTATEVEYRREEGVCIIPTGCLQDND